MCGIVGSLSLETTKSLAQQIKERGTRAWSLCLIDLDTYSIAYKHRSSIPISSNQIDEVLPIDPPSSPYYIIHVQSPTAKSYRYHPATNQYGALWHNGMLESYELRRLQRQQEQPVWDTELILDLLSEEDRTAQPQFRELEKFQGSFACYYLEYGKGLYAFRNMISPQYYSADDKTFCSIKFPESEKTVAGDVIHMITGDVIERFTNDVNPFGIGA